MPPRIRFAPDEPRPCVSCGETKAAEEFHAKERNDDGSIRTRQSQCKSCQKARLNELRGFKQREEVTKRTKKRRRAKKRRERYKERVSTDIDYRNHRRKTNRENARKERERAKTDPEVAERIRAREERYRAKLAADPERRAEAAEIQRLDYRMRHPESNRRYFQAINAYNEARELLAAKPFLMFLLAYEFTPEQWEAKTGVPAKRFRDVLNGQDKVSLAVVDQTVTVGLGRPDFLNDLYPIKV